MLGRDYRIRLARRGSAISVMAPHGGRIEPGASEIAEAIAGANHNFYAFEGIRDSGNRDLHITSAAFDEPAGLDIASNSIMVLTVHGVRGNDEIVYIGGLFDKMAEIIRAGLENGGFRTAENERFPGVSSQNLCNRGLSGMGVQLELTRGLRKAMFRNFSAGCAHPAPLFHSFVESAGGALLHCARLLSDNPGPGPEQPC